MKLKRLGTLVHKAPAYLWRVSRNQFLLPYTFMVLGQQIEMMERQDWLERLRQGKVLGVDREGRFEATFCDMLVSKIDASTVMLDVGAGRGFYSVIASHFCPAENIHAFEPDLLARYILGINNKKYCGGQLNIVSHFVAAETKGKSIALDDYCAEHGLEPTLVKMDIEGAEIHALAGMCRICLEHHPVILLEFHVRKLREEWRVDPHQVLRMLQSYGYRLRFNGHHGHLVANAKERDPTWHDTPPNDFICAVLAELES